MEFIYTLAFIKRNDEILMMNRYKQPWKGMWNGIGGKRLKDESAIDCILREIKEESNIELSISQIHDKGIVTWNDDFQAESSGLHIFFVEVANDFLYPSPIETDEGILAWKKIDWLSDKDNLGVAYNIPFFIHEIIHDMKKYHYHCVFSGNQLLEVRKTKHE